MTIGEHNSTSLQPQYSQRSYTQCKHTKSMVPCAITNLGEGSGASFELALDDLVDDFVLESLVLVLFNVAKGTYDRRLTSGYSLRARSTMPRSFWNLHRKQRKTHIE